MKHEINAVKMGKIYHKKTNTHICNEAKASGDDVSPWHPQSPFLSRNPKYQKATFHYTADIIQSSCEIQINENTDHATPPPPFAVNCVPEE